MKQAFVSVVFLLALLFAQTPAQAVYNVTTTNSTVTPPDNCGFTVTGTTDGWIRIHLLNDTGSGRDLWVRAGQFYPLRVKDVLISTSAPYPTGLSFDDSQTCGYTRSFGADECGNYSFGDIPGNVGFYAGGFSSSPGEIEVLVRTDSPSDPWRTYEVVPGEFVLGDIATCQLAAGPGPTYITTVGQ
jgi:hypothetical protein